MNVIKNSAKTMSFIFAISVLLTGCSRYEIEPNYNKNSKTLIINNLEFKDVELKEDKKAPATQIIGFFNKQESSYLIYEKKCRHLNFDRISSNSRNGYLTMNTEDIFEKNIVEKRGGNCDVTRINNLKFLECLANNQGYYAITSSEINFHANGYLSVETIFTDKFCYKKILKHSKKQAEEDGVEVENYTIK